MNDDVSFFVNEAHVLWQLPGARDAGVVLVAALTIAVLRWTYRRAIARRDRQIDAFRQMLGTISPAEIKARIDALESQIRSMGPRRLTDAQRQHIAALLSTSPGRVAIAQDVAEARPLSRDLIVAFQNAGWRVHAPKIAGPGNAPPNGIGVIVPSTDNLTLRQSLIVRSLREQGIAFDLQQGSLSEPPASSGAPPVDAHILVSQRVH